MEAHGHDEPRGTRLIAAGQKLTGLLQDSVAAKVSDQAALDRLDAAHTAVKAVRRWIDDLLPIVGDDRDPLGVRDFATHHLPLEDAPRGYDIFRDKADGCIKVVLQP